jgi:RimJ/RimL family protein N-acetyltransferase
LGLKNKRLAFVSKLESFLKNSRLGSREQPKNSEKFLVYRREKSTLINNQLSQYSDLKTIRFPLTIRSALRLHIWRHILHNFCRFRSRHAYYLVVRKDNIEVFRCLIHRCVLRSRDPELKMTSFSAVYTNPNFRNQGIAQYVLTQEIESIFSKDDLIWVFRVRNEISKKLCLKIGFVPYGELIQYKILGIQQYRFTNISNN